MLFDMPKKEDSIIKVIGVGGGGGNAVGHMFDEGIIGVDFAICNTDNQALDSHRIPTKIQLGPTKTGGRGAGSIPETGKQACIESIDDVRKFLEGDTKMLFITAGMGGGTGTGAAPIIAKAAKELDILTVGIVTLPFKFEGGRRRRQALEGLDNLKRNVDCILVISNDRLKEIHGDLGISDAFSKADDILSIAAKGIAEIITVPGKINVDFEDVKTVMSASGVAIMGSAICSGEDRARRAIDTALNSPLLEDNDIRGAQHILLNITSGDEEVTMDEIGEITEYVQEEAGYGTDLIWGHCHDPELGDKLSITLIATGFDEGAKKMNIEEQKETVFVPLEDEREVIDMSQITENNIDQDHRNQYTVDFSVEEVKTKSAAIEKSKPDYIDPMDYDMNKVKKLEEEEKRKREHDALRLKYLRDVNSKPLDSPKAISDLESQPAYMRRNVVLDDVPNADESKLSGFSITDDPEGPIRDSRNSFLHDNVD